MAIYKNTPPIVTSGLICNLDAGNTLSYNSGSINWYDLSGNNITCTLVNGTNFINNNGGYFTFDASNDYISSSNNTILDTQTPSVEVWIKTNNLSQNGFWFEKGALNTQYSLFQEGTNTQWRMNIGGSTNTLSVITATYLTTSSWYQIVGTYVSGDRRLYINGTFVKSDTLSGTISTNASGISIGAYGSPRGYYYNGNLAVCRVYNRPLSAVEVLQNYNAMKRRFNLD